MEIYIYIKSLNIAAITDTIAMFMPKTHLSISPLISLISPRTFSISIESSWQQQWY
jgi:hypothetical protein